MLALDPSLLESYPTKLTIRLLICLLAAKLGILALTSATLISIAKYMELPGRGLNIPRKPINLKKKEQNMKIFFSVLLITICVNLSIAQSIYIWCEGEFIVKDPQGRRTGRDLDEGYQEIPNSSYDTGGAPPFYIKQFRYNPINKVNLILRRTSAGKLPYEFEIQISRAEKTDTSFSFNGVADEDKIDEYEIHFDPDTTQPVWCLKKVNSQTFHRDLDLCHELGLVKTDTAYNALKDYFDDYETHRQQGDYDGAAKVLTQFLDTLTSMDASQRTQDAVAILKVDVEMLQELQEEQQK